MNSPKSHQSLKRGEKKESRRRPSHKNKKFYNSKAWKETRSAYMRHYRDRLFKHIPNEHWEQMGLDAHQVSYILSLDYLPCEICLKLYCAEAYDKIEEGKELDHIQPVNPENAMDRVFIGAEAIKTVKRLDGEPDLIRGKLNYFFGDPFSFDNLQLLCPRHHSKKSQRER